MRLKQLEVVGLKSFANKTTLDFHPGVTAIVGPNGCGKSNVVDAIRWVLGEQSAKHLRGDSMEDIIFKGNGRLGPSGMAEVSLTFSNEESAPPASEDELDVSSLPEHFRNLSEITVSRRYFRSGESEYYINRTPCRLKDITELFLGTGIGSKAYAIIEQGRVEQLINSKPEDRRLFIEEAGGTTLYRSRRLAAERKIERTRENLLRVNDVLREIERQIQYLNRLAKRAEKYRALRDELRDHELRLGSHRWTRITDEDQRHAQRQAELRRDIVDAQQELEELERERQDLAQTRRRAEEELASSKELAAVVAAEIDAADERRKLLGEEQQERLRRRERLRASAESLQVQNAKLEEELATARAEAKELGGFLAEEETATVDQEQRLARATQAVTDARSDVDEAKRRLIAVVSAETDSRNDQDRQERALADARSRRRKAKADAYFLDEQIAGASLASAQRKAALARLELQLAAARGSRDDVAGRVRDVAASLAGQERALAERREEQVQLGSTLQSLQQIHDAYEGYAPAVRSLLLADDRPEWILGVVGDVIEASPRWERALAAALGDYVNCVAVREADDRMAAIERLESAAIGRGSFVQVRDGDAVPAVGREHQATASLPTLLSLVRVQAGYQRVADVLIGDVLVAPDLRSALAAADLGARIVTEAGEIVDDRGVVTGGGENLSEQELVSRRRRIQEIADRVQAGAAAVVECEVAVAELREEQEALQARLAELDRETQLLTTTAVAAEREIERIALDLPRLGDRSRLVRFECDAALRDIVTAQVGCERAAASLAELAHTRRTREEELLAAEESLQTCDAEVEVVAESLRRSNQSLAEKRQRHSVLETVAGRLEAQRRDRSERDRAIADELVDVETQLQRLAASLEQVEAFVAAKREEATRLTGRVDEARQHLEGRAVALSKCESRCNTTRDQIDQRRTEDNKIEVALAELRMRRDHLREEIRERYDLEVADLPPGEPLADGEESEVASRVQDIRAGIARLGEVNTGAIEELSELEDRAAFLRNQRDDLERSIADLERTIQRLNRVSRTKFAETFAAVNEQFQEILPRLFRGGEARLVLTDEHNLLESGVEIVVRPPGKRLDSITLLSGGEKALVAVSLIFSLFMINPTPFCFLDEVDAPLDDANIGRFSGLVREMSERSQFIVITHNKRTMEAANALYGVTMEEPGISKIISVAAA